MTATNASAWATRPGPYVALVELGYQNIRTQRRTSIGVFEHQDLTFSGGGPEGLGYMPTLYGRWLHVALGGEFLATARGDRFQIDLRDSTGALRRIFRAPGD